MWDRIQVLVEWIHVGSNRTKSSRLRVEIVGRHVEIVVGLGGIEDNSQEISTPHRLAMSLGISFVSRVTVAIGLDLDLAVAELLDEIVGVPSMTGRPA